ncbi:MAG TPA: hypothetical protein VJM08_15010 [Anaerolineales bacterium]|nr:hypothetical protein [Anaerolineales bacterium]
MQPRTRIGLTVGAIGLVLNICVAGFLGFCGPVLSLVAGGVAGFLAAQQERQFTKGDGARVGATAGGTAGGLIILGQIIGGLGALAYYQYSGTPLPFGTAPSASAPASELLIYYVSGAGTGLCFGVIGALLAAGAGAGAGYLATPDQPVIPPSQNIMS